MSTTTPTPFRFICFSASASAGLLAISLLLTATPCLAGNLQSGQVLIADQELGLSGTCNRGLTYVDLQTGDQFPLSLRLSAGLLGAPLAGGDILAVSAVSSTLELVRITPSNGHHTLEVLADGDFTPPLDVAEDPNGNYVLINDSAIARYETQTGILEILASGSNIDTPAGLAIAANGDIFVADTGLGEVLRIPVGAGIQPYASGDLLAEPVALAFAPDGDLLVTDSTRVIRIDSATQQQSFFGGTFENTVGLLEDIAVTDSGRVFVIQDRPRCNGDLLQRGLFEVPEVGSPVAVLCLDNTAAPLKNFATIGPKAASDSLIVAGFFSNAGTGNGAAIIELDPDTLETTVISVQSPSGAAAFGPGGELYIADHVRDAVYRIDPKTGSSEEIASGGLLTDPRDLLVSDDGGFVYVLDNDGIVRVNPVTGSQASVYDGAAEFNDPTHLRRDRNGNFIVADLFSETLIFIDSGNFSDSTITGGDLFRIVDVADTGGGDLVVADVGPNALILVAPDGSGQSLVGELGYFMGRTPASMVPEADGKVLVNVGGAGSGEAGLLRIDPSDGSQTVVSDLPICIGADIEHVIVPVPLMVCGDPVDPTPPPALVAPRAITATDALRVLQAAVGAAQCELCVCDVDGSGAITASDALAVLQISVGAQIALNCPACP